MKKNYVSNLLSMKSLLFLLLFLPALNMQAQCPTVPVSPQVICDASRLTFSDLNAFANPGANPVRWFLNPTGGSPLPQTQLVRQGTYYAGDTSGNCGTRDELIVDFTVDPSGQSLEAIFCDNENPTIQSYINQALEPNIPAGGSVEIYSDFALTDQRQPAEPLPNNANYFIVFVDNAGCRSQVETGSIAVFASPATPTPPPIQEFCSDTAPTVGDLNPGTTDNFNWYMDVDNNNNPIPPALAASTLLVDGATYYLQADNFFCESDTVPVVVNIAEPPVPGQGATVEYCIDAVPTADIDLFPFLTGMPDTTGTWTGPTTITNGNTGTTNIGGLTAGSYSYIYTVPGTDPCPDQTATVTIIIYDILTSGDPSAASPLTFCESQASSTYDLFLLIENQDAGGLWTQGTSSADPAVSSTFDFTGLAPGTYNFTYSQNVDPNPCPEESTTVVVNILADPDAGTAVPVEICENEIDSNSPFNLFDALDGSQDDNNGTWTDASGGTVSNTIDITNFTVADGPYSYTYTIDNGSCSDSETITIEILPAPESGNYIGTPFEVCEDQAATNSPFDLFSLLDGTQDTNGTWYAGSNTSGTAVANPIDLASLGTGNFDFTYSVPPIGSCTDVDVTVTVVITELPEAGTPTPFEVCETDRATFSPLDLFNQLTGEDAGGDWADDDTTGALNGSNVDLTQLAIGTYNFTYTVSELSCTATSTVVITVTEAPDAGNYVGVPFEVCEDQAAANSPFDLASLLDGTQDSTGSWFNGPNASGTAVSNPIDLSTLGTGTFEFTYNVPALGTCAADSETVTVIITELPEAGTPTPFEVCETDRATFSPLDLFNQLTGEDAGGDWADDDATGSLNGSNVDLTLLAIGSYNFTYTITNASCTSTSIVTVTVTEAPEAGTGTDFDICLEDVTSGQQLDLFDQLVDNDTNGTWNDDNATGALTNSTVDLSALAAGSYNFTYTVPAQGSCAADFETITITINDIAPPTASANQEFCDQATVAELSATGNNIQWYSDAALTNLLASTDVLVNGENYYATQTDATTNCESSTSTVVAVTIYETPNTGMASPITVCSDNAMVDLFTALDGTQDAGGTWVDTDGTGALSGSTFDASAVSPGTYSFEYTIAGSAPCADSSTITTITVQNPVSAGTSTSIDLCSDNGTIDLFPLLGSADAGGTWSPSLASNSGVFDPLVDQAGTYTYTVMNGCNTSTATVDVTVTAAPDAGTSNTIMICEVDEPFDLTTRLGGTPDSNGTWSPLLASGNNTFDPGVDTAGVYTYTVAATSPCSTDAVSQIDVMIEETSPPSVTSSSLTFCASEQAMVMDLDVAVSGTMITWYDSVDSTTPLADDVLLINGNVYYATQTSTTGCESDDRVQVTAIVNDAPTPTLVADGGSFCVNDNPTLLDLTQNIDEYDSNTNNITWYADVESSTPLPLSSQLSANTTYYAVITDFATGCESSIRLAVIADLTACGKVFIPDGFSPNNDSVNDTFEIENLGFLYPNYELEVYNRNGILVYQGRNGTPDFDGTSNQKVLFSDGQLPVGVYFYILRFNDEITKPRQGRIYISR